MACLLSYHHYIVEDESESSDYGQEGTESSNFSEEWVWGGETVYLRQIQSGRNGSRNVTEGSRSGYSAGDIQEQRNGGGVSSNWYYAKWMICKGGN